MNIYLLLKALHIIAIIAWMAGLLYLPRIFVYHCQTSYGSESHEKFVQMEYRLLKYIMNPAMILSWILGIALLLQLGHQASTQFWLQAKLFWFIAVWLSWFSRILQKKDLRRILIKEQKIFIG